MASEPSFTLKCSAKLYLKDNIFWIIIATSITMFTMYKCKGYRRRSRQAKFLANFYDNLKQALLANRSQGLTESEIL